MLLTLDTQTTLERGFFNILEFHYAGLPFYIGLYT